MKESINNLTLQDLQQQFNEYRVACERVSDENNAGFFHFSSRIQGTN